MTRPGIREGARPQTNLEISLVRWVCLWPRRMTLAGISRLVDNPDGMGSPSSTKNECRGREVVDRDAHVVHAFNRRGLEGSQAAAPGTAIDRRRDERRSPSISPSRLRLGEPS